jgi:hypothetical protein
MEMVKAAMSSAMWSIQDTAAAQRAADRRAKRDGEGDFGEEEDETKI